MDTKTFKIVICLVGWFLEGLVAQLIVSEQEMCMNGQCKKMLNGHLVIQNNQVSLINQRNLAVFILKIYCFKDISLNFDSSVVNGKNAKESDPGSSGFKIKIKKSPVLIAYDLNYASTLYHDFQEDIRLFSFSQVEGDPYRFCDHELRSCQKVRDEYLYGTPNLPPGQKNWTQESPMPPGSQGSCCWCPELYVTQRMWWNVYLSKSCPIWIPPWWTAFRIGGWNWQYSLEVELSWFSPTESSIEKLVSTELQSREQECRKTSKNTTDCSRLTHRESGTQVSLHTLNSSSPSFYDSNFGASVQVISSGPPFGSANAKNLNGFYMLQPTFSPKGVPSSLNIPSLRSGCGKSSKNQTEEEKNDCLKPTLIIPPENVDFTGVSCDKIGTSVHTWSSVNGRFCYHPPGTCQRAQVASFYKKVIEDYSMGRVSEYSVQAQNPGSPQLILDQVGEIGQMDDEELENTTSLQSRRFFLGYSFDSIFDTEIMFSVEASSVSWAATSSPGIITFIEPPPLESCVAMSNYGCPLKVYVKNSGTIDSAFVVQIPYCTKSGSQTSEVDPIMAQSRKIQANSIGIFTFILGVSVLTGSEYKCIAVLYNSFSIQLDQNTFTFSTNTATISISSSSSVISDVVVNTTSLTNKKYGSMYSGNKCISCGVNFWCLIANFGECIKLGLKCIGIVLGVIFGIVVALRVARIIIQLRKSKSSNNNTNGNNIQAQKSG
ncbi:Male gamete fusion factor [Cryptosporidium felis]|nr:Male gamete fusion factor [Cryptosporidium felis]